MLIQCLLMHSFVQVPCNAFTDDMKGSTDIDDFMPITRTVFQIHGAVYFASVIVRVSLCKTGVPHHIGGGNMVHP